MQGVLLPGAEWEPFTHRSVSSTPLTCRGVMLHTMVGTALGSWHYHNKAGMPYVHAYYDGAGRKLQVQGLQYRSAGQLELNPYFISFELEDHGPYFKGGGSTCDTIPALTDRMMDELARDILFCHKRFGFPLRLMTDSGQLGLGYHRLGVPGSPEWKPGTPRTSTSAGKCCPGTRRIHQIKTELFPEILRLAGKIENLPAPYVEDDPMDIIVTGTGTKLKAVYLTGNKAVRLSGATNLNTIKKSGATVVEVDTDDFDRLVKARGGIYEG